MTAFLAVGFGLWGVAFTLQELFLSLAPAVLYVLTKSSYPGP